MKQRSKTRVFARLASRHLGGGGLSLLLLVLSSCLIIISLFSPARLSPIRHVVTDVMSPVITGVTQGVTSAVETLSDISSLAALRAENNQLKAENERLKSWYQKALTLQSENQSLQSLLNLNPEPDLAYISARVIADSGNAYIKSVLISAGARHGVKKGQAVLSGEGLAGRIIDVSDRAARVLLLNDFNSRVPIIIEGSRQKAILSGENTHYPVLKHLPPDTVVSEGERIVTSGHGGLFPPGLPVGRIHFGADKKPYVQTYADMTRVSYIRILDIPSNAHISQSLERAGAHKK